MNIKLISKNIVINFNSIDNLFAQRVVARLPVHRAAQSFHS